MASSAPSHIVSSLLIAKLEDLDVSRSRHEPFQLPQGFVAVPLLESDRDVWAGLTTALPEESEDNFLRNFSIDLMLKCAIAGVCRVSRYRPMAFVNSDQSCVVWSEDGYDARTLDEFEGEREGWPINVALRKLGVGANGYLDECEALGLNELWRRSDWPLVGTSDGDPVRAMLRTEDHAASTLMPPEDAAGLLIAKTGNVDVSRSRYEPVPLPQEFIAVPFLQSDQAWWQLLTAALPEGAYDRFVDDYSLDLMLRCAIVGVSRATSKPMVILDFSRSRQTGVVWTYYGYDLRATPGYYRNYTVERRDWPINTALRALGVDASGYLDECDVLGLYELWWRDDWPLRHR